MRSELARVILMSLAVGLLGCADFTRGAYWDLPDEDGEPGGVEGELGYAADIHPLLDAGCERCHGPGNSAGHTGYVISDDLEASYASALEFVELGSPSASRLLSKTAGSGHGGGTIFDDRSDEYATILAWIEQGAAP
jgi:hypothetical protein